MSKRVWSADLSQTDAATLRLGVRLAVLVVAVAAMLIDSWWFIGLLGLWTVTQANRAVKEADDE